MAWHTVQETLKLTGKSRSQLYRDMAKGLVSYRTGKNDRREFETSELIRAYGELRTSETPKRHKEGHSKSVVSQAENAQLDVIQQKLDALQQTVTLMLEDKMAYPPGVPLLMPGEMLTKESRTVLDFLLMLCSVGQHYPGFETDIHGAKQDEDGVYRVRVLKMAG